MTDGTSICNRRDPNFLYCLLARRSIMTNLIIPVPFAVFCIVIAFFTYVIRLWNK